MAFYRTKRIDLSEFDPKWNESFILVKTSGLQQVFDIQRNITKKQGVIKTLSKIIEDPQSTDEQVEKAESDIMKESEAIVALTYRIIEDAFVSGMIYDNDEQKTRPLLREEIKLLDTEITKSIIGSIQGEVPKA